MQITLLHQDHLQKSRLIDITMATPRRCLVAGTIILVGKKSSLTCLTETPVCKQSRGIKRIKKNMKYDNLAIWAPKRFWGAYKHKEERVDGAETQGSTLVSSISSATVCHSHKMPWKVPAPWTAALFARYASLQVANEGKHRSLFFFFSECNVHVIH